MTRAVFDPNVLVAAVLSPLGAPAACMRAHADGRFEIVACPHLVEELWNVLRRPKFRRYLTTERAEGYVASLERECTLVEDPIEVRPVSTDPDDDYLVALARGAAAHVVVSGDPHLTTLRLADLRIVTPREFIERLP